MTVESVRSTQPKPSLWDADVIIVGGGLTGPLLSLALAQVGMTRERLRDCTELSTVINGTWGMARN
jgi:hypothetical protein